MKVLFVQSDKPSNRHQWVSEYHKELLRLHNHEVFTKTIDSCRHDGLKYDTVWFDEFVKLDKKGEIK